VFEDAWKAAAAEERGLWRGLAQLAVGVTHAARGNVSGAATLLRRGAVTIEPYQPQAPHEIDIAGLSRWARNLAQELESDGSSSHEGRVSNGGSDSDEGTNSNAGGDPRRFAPRLRLSR
jgi:hypothetical protein